MSASSIAQPVRRPASGTTFAVVASGAALALVVAIGAIGNTRPAPATPALVVTPAPGEFRLGPGNGTPPGIVNPLPRSFSEPAPGEFRLGPGNGTPPGIVNPLR
jgi:hypothetical protein